MILHPDEQKALDVIDRALGAGERHPAGMFTTFTRLTAREGIPRMRTGSVCVLAGQ